MTITAVDAGKSASESDPYYEDRVNLAAVFRMTARLDMHESVANHFSYAVSDDAKQFLINPLGRHFSNIRASELLLLDADDDSTMIKTRLSPMVKLRRSASSPRPIPSKPVSSATRLK